jgi:hypothetical protein
MASFFKNVSAVTAAPGASRTLGDNFRAKMAGAAAEAEHVRILK